ncbi:hypothetical protein PR048_017405 [Dryococelus australis]|uniref:Uncharacterized protein n=1 Tax=Dryococelus australis TaxID=614101 RepID=A0ABQ9H9E7_9NEOP|nr:hypothetical protein PR048_017405 [Dryococelus australis]
MKRVNKTPDSDEHGRELAAFPRVEVSPFWLKIGTSSLYTSGSSPPTKAIRAQYPVGSLRIFACGNRAGRCRWLVDFFRGSPVSPALSFRRCSTFTSITLIGSQDLDVKRRPNSFTSPKPMRVIQMSMEQSRNERVGKREIPEKTRRPTASYGTIPTCESPELPGRGLNQDCLEAKWSKASTMLATQGEALRSRLTQDTILRSAKIKWHHPQQSTPEPAWRLGESDTSTSSREQLNEGQVETRWRGRTKISQNRFPSGIVFLLLKIFFTIFPTVVAENVEEQRLLRNRCTPYKASRGLLLRCARYKRRATKEGRREGPMSTTQAKSSLQPARGGTMSANLMRKIRKSKIARILPPDGGTDGLQTDTGETGGACDKSRLRRQPRVTRLITDDNRNHRARPPAKKKPSTSQRLVTWTPKRRTDIGHCKAEPGAFPTPASFRGGYKNRCVRSSLTDLQGETASGIKIKVGTVHIR